MRGRFVLWVGASFFELIGPLSAALDECAQANDEFGRTRAKSQRVFGRNGRICERRSQYGSFLYVTQSYTFLDLGLAGLLKCIRLCVVDLCCRCSGLRMQC